MARTNLPVTNTTRAGAAFPAEVNGDTTNNHSFANDGKTILIMRNADSSSRNVTIRVSQTVDGLAVTSRVIAVPAGATRVAGPFPVSAYGATVNVDVDAASGTNLKLSTLRVA